MMSQSKVMGAKVKSVGTLNTRKLWVFLLKIMRGIPLFLEQLRVFGDHWYLQMPLENSLGVVTVCNGIRCVLQVKGYTWNEK